VTRSARTRWRFAGAAITAATVVAVILALPTRSEAVQGCGPSLGYQVCVSAPDGDLSGDVRIDITTSSSSGIYEVEAMWGPTSSSTTHLISDFEPPWGFTWRTDRYLDATQSLNVRVKTNDTTAGAAVSIQLTLRNGNVTSVPTNPSDWASRFQPRPSSGDPVFAAVGDAADGRARSNAVAASIAASPASILLYLGDVYERGTPAEWDQNYGRSSWDDPGGGRAWGALAAYTVPTLGNHEVANLEAYRDYWHRPPDYRTFTAGGVRFLDLNSECSLVGGCGTTSAQYAFVQQTLTNNTLPCVVAFWHRPVLGAVQDNTEMRPIWKLLANNGGDLVLNGHQHDMEAYTPLNGDLAAGQPDSHMVELVSGAGGHALYTTANSDPRGVWQALKTTGALYVTAVGGGDGPATRLEWAFRDANRTLITNSQGAGQGSVPCSTTADTDPPTAPGAPNGSSPSPGTISIAWSASQDASTPITYRVYRDGDTTNAIASTIGTTFTDTGLAPGSQHTYRIGAVDRLGNGPTLGPGSDPITVASPSASAFADDFSSGNFSQWTGFTRMTIDASNGAPSAPSARADTSGGAAIAYAYENLSTPMSTICMSARFNVASPSNTPTLMRLRTASNGPILKVFVNAAGILYLRSDAGATQVYSGASLGVGWHRIEVCGTVGTSSSWDLYRDGARIVNGWTANTGTAPVGRVEIGNTQAVAVTMNVDDVVVDQTAG
jgi:hypothetical protein